MLITKKRLSLTRLLCVVNKINIFVQTVRCLSAVGTTVWCGYRNKVHVIEPRSKTLLYSLEAHPRQESQVRQMACDGDGVWVRIYFYRRQKVGRKIYRVANTNRQARCKTEYARLD